LEIQDGHGEIATAFFTMQEGLLAMTYRAPGFPLKQESVMLIAISYAKDKNSAGALPPAL